MKAVSFLSGIAIVIFIAGCTDHLVFDEGVKEIQILDAKYGASMISVPETVENTDSLRAQLVEYKAANQLGPALDLLLDYRIKVLAAAKLHEEGWKYGRSGTTIYGFGCKSLEKVKESAQLRNESSSVGGEAVAILQKFIDSYPNRAKSLNLTQRNVLELKTIYFQTQEQAVRDDKIITSLCNKNQTDTQQNDL